MEMRMSVLIKIFLKILNKLLNDKSIVILLMGAWLVLAACNNDSPTTKAHPVSTLYAFTGSPTRLVWVQDLLDNRDVVAEGKHLGLVGYDSEDGRGERFILSGPENFMRPLITPSGKQVVFSDFHQQTVHLVDWSGKNRHFLAKGLGVAVWYDVETDIEWVYIARDPVSPSKGPTFRQLYRVQIQNPDVEELVWDNTVVGAAVQLSSDGLRFSAEIPWPNCAVIDLELDVARRYGKGCWPALAPDQSYRFWFFDGAHRNLEMVDTRTGAQSRISLTDAPGINGSEVYHPRWSNHSKFMVMTGPYTIREGGNNIRGGGAGIEIYAGKFNASYTEMDSWFQVSNNQRADFYPDMWVAKDVDAYQKIIQQTGVSASVADDSARSVIWPVVNEALLFAWDNVAAANEWRSPAKRFCQTEVVPEGRARFSLDYQMNLGTGWFLAKRFPEPDRQEFGAENALTVEFVIDFPEQEERIDGVLLSLGEENEAQTLLRIEKGELVLEERRVAKSAQFLRLGKLPAGQSHVVLVLDSGAAALRINENTQRVYPRECNRLVFWPLLIGSSLEKNRIQSTVLLERVALYTGKLNEAELLQIFQMETKRQETAQGIAPVVARIELLSASSIPLPEDIAPYRRGLVVNEYKVLEVIEGVLEDPVILVAHWAILGGETLPTAERRVGEIYELRLDAFLNRPELEGERLSMESDDLLLPMYYNVD